MPNGEPLCGKCPLSQDCFAYQNHVAEELPIRIKKVKRKVEEKTVFLLTSPNGRIAIQKRRSKRTFSGDV